MNLDPEIIKASTALASHAAKKSSTLIWDKIRTVKQKGEEKEVIGSLEEIINDLIADKNQLIQIAQAYEETLITQKISDEEIDYITSSVVPLLEEVLSRSSADEAAKVREAIDIFKPILSKETFNILQLLGFNFKQAIGEPLTNLVSTSITTNMPISGEKSVELRILDEQKQIEFFKLMQDKEAYERYIKITGLG
jgi:hypothetical protein